MFERFTDRARRVVVLAQEEARMLGHDYIGTEHLLLALIHEGEGVAAKALLALDVDLDTLRREVEALVGRGQQATSGHIPFTPRAKKVLELALRESVQLGHDYIGTEHLLLGLVRGGEGPAAEVLQQRGIELNTVRQEVIRLLHGHQGGEGRSRRRVARARSGGEGTMLEEISHQLQLLGARLAAIEDKLGSRSPRRGSGYAASTRRSPGCAGRRSPPSTSTNDAAQGVCAESPFGPSSV
jgi:ATP-dependent Clp protease ATP-binding subunit ClpA